MVDLDPRARPQATVENFNDSLLERAAELMGLLNRTIGSQGDGSATVSFLDEDGSVIDETLSAYVIAPESGDPKWKLPQTIYFQTAPERIQEIQVELQESLDSFQNDLVNNVGELFNVLLEKENSINSVEASVKNASSSEELLNAQDNLELHIETVLTSEAALNEMILAFFEQINLTIERLDSVFNSIDDFDDDYSNGSTQTSASKYIVALPPINDEARPAMIAGSAEEILDIYLDEAKRKHQEQYGAGSFSQQDEQEFVKVQNINHFVNRSLKLTDGVIDNIISELGLTENDVASIENMSDFLRMVSYDELITYASKHYGTEGNVEATERAMMIDHLEMTTPIYYSDERSLRDILAGRQDDPNSSNQIDQIFDSIGEHIADTTQAVQDLLVEGYNKVAQTELQQNIRALPMAGVNFIESKKVGLSEERQRELEGYIRTLLERQSLRISKRITELDETIHAEMIKDLTKAMNLIAEYPQKSTLEEIDTILRPILGYGDFDPNIELERFLDNVDLKTANANVHLGLYGSEVNESGKKNSEYEGRRRPVSKTGEPVKDNKPIPPVLSPTPLSAVIAKLGNTIVEKSKELESDALPDETWFDDNATMITDINSKLGELGASSVGEAFLNNLRDHFKDIFTDFFTKAQPHKNTMDQAEIDLREVIDIKDKTQVLMQSDSNVNLNRRTLTSNLINIEEGLSQDLKASNNFVNRAGLEQTKDYLEQTINSLDGVNYQVELASRYSEYNELNSRLQSLINNSGDPAEIARIQAEMTKLNNEIIALQRDNNNLDKARELLFGSEGSSNNPQEGSTLDLIRDFNNDINSFIAKQDPGSQNGESNIDFIARTEITKRENYRDSVINYSDTLTNFEADTDNNGTADIEEAFANSVTDSNLDLDNDGENDFVNLAGIISGANQLAGNILNVFGSKEAVEGGIDKQGLRRLILLMFVFTMLEGGMWNDRYNDTDTSRYEVA